jgi:hypothetical protein
VRIEIEGKGVEAAEAKADLKKCEKMVPINWRPITQGWKGSPRTKTLGACNIKNYSLLIYRKWTDFVES